MNVDKLKAELLGLRYLGIAVIAGVSLTSSVAEFDSSTKPLCQQFGAVLLENQGTAKRDTVAQAWSKMDSLRNLDARTLGYAVPSSKAIELASCALDALINAGFIPDGVMASREEGVMLCFVRGDKYADVEFLNTGEVLAATSTGDGNPDAWEFCTVEADFTELISRFSSFFAPQNELIPCAA